MQEGEDCDWRDHDFWGARRAMKEVPVRLDKPTDGHCCWGFEACDLRRLAPEPAKAEIKTSNTDGTVFVLDTGNHRIVAMEGLVYVHDDICPPGEHDPLTDTRTRRQALEDLARGGRWKPEPKPWFGDRR